MQSLRERGIDRRRQRILLAAHSLIGEKGLANLTMRAVADRAELSVPSIYNLIGSRDDVIAAVLAAGGSQLSAAMCDAPEEPLPHAFAAVDALADILIRNQTVVRQVLTTWAPTGGPRTTLFTELRALIRDAFVDAKRLGQVRRTCDPDVLASRVEALAGGAVLAWVGNERGDERLRRDLHHGVALVFAATASSTSRASFDRALRSCERGLRLVTDSATTAHPARTVPA
jgi:AcrR family transcriptional regulator